MLDRRQARLLAAGVAAARAAIGLAALVAPEALSAPWVGRGQNGSRVLARGLGGRDLALGLGALLSMRHSRPVRGWVEAGGLADAIDAASTLASWPTLPRRGRWVVLALAAGAAATARPVSLSVDA